MQGDNDWQILLIVPAYNESENIERVVDTIRSRGYSYVVVNDGSTDETEQILKTIQANHISLISNLGIGGAVQAGYRYAAAKGFDIAVQFDGDGQHDIAYIESIVHPIISGEADLVVGSRFVGTESDFQSSGARRVGIKLLSAVLKLATGVRIYDVTSGFRAVNRRAIALFAGLYPSDYPEPESISFAIARGLKVKEVPVAMHERKGGRSSIAGFDVVWYMVKVGLSIVLRGSYRGRRNRV